MPRPVPRPRDREGGGRAKAQPAQAFGSALVLARGAVQGPGPVVRPERRGLRVLRPRVRHKPVQEPRGAEQGLGLRGLRTLVRS